MSPAAAEQQVVRPNYDALGVFFWNPHPAAAGKVSKLVGGVRYPYGTHVVVVCGKHYALRPKSTFHVSSSDPNYKLVIQNIERLVGSAAKNDYGVKPIDIYRLEAEGEAYLKEIDREGSNILAETLHQIQLNFEKENAERVGKDLPKRPYTIEEKRSLRVLKGLLKSLKVKGAYEEESVLNAIEEGAEAEPEWEEELSALPMAQLRKKAALLNVLMRPSMKKHELIAAIEAERKRQQQEAMLDQAQKAKDAQSDPAAPPEKKEAKPAREVDATGSTETEEDEDGILDEEIDVDEGDLPE